MATSAYTLLQVVALSLPAFAIIMQAILYIQADNSRESLDFFFEFRFLEVSFLLLVIAAAAFTYEISLTVNSPIIRIGLTVMIFGYFLIVPATMVGVRRGVSDTPPEEAILSIFQRVTPQPTIQLVLALLTMFLIALSLVLGISQVEIEATTQQFGVIAVSVLTTTFAAIFTLNIYLRKRLQARNREEWKSEVDEIRTDILDLVESEEEPGEALIEDPSFRGRFFDMIDDLDEIYSSPPSSLDIERYPDLSGLDREHAAVRELLEEKDRTEEYIEKAEQELVNIHKQLSSIQNQLDSIAEDYEEDPFAEARVPSDELKELQAEKKNLQEELARFEQNLEDARSTRQAVFEEAKDIVDRIVDDVRRIKVVVRAVQ